MTERVLLFCGEVRRTAPEITWEFHIAEPWLVIHAQHPIRNGWLTAERAVCPQRAARFFASVALEVVREIQTEFAQRLPNYR